MVKIKIKKVTKKIEEELVAAKKEVVQDAKALGPGLITGAADDDPSGVVTYTVAGAQFGYQLLWLAPFSLPLMVAIQEMCARVGAVTGKGLAGLIRQNYSKKLLYFAVALLLIANSINIGADLGALASVTQLVLGHGNFAVLTLVFTIITLLLEIFISYKIYVKYLKWLTLSLFAYFITVLIVNNDIPALLRSTLVPSMPLTKEAFMAVIGVLGTTISPYLFFWQASEEVEEEIDQGRIGSFGRGKPRIGKRWLKLMQRDIFLGMLFSNLAFYFIVLTAAATLFGAGVRDINTAADAAKALAPLAGNFASIVFAIGVIGVGLLGIPVLAGSAAYAVSEAFSWKEGLYKKLEEARGFYGIIVLATLIGLFINFINIPPMKALYYAAVINGIIAVPLILIILIVANNKNIMGERINGFWSNLFGIMAFILMGAASISLILFTFF